MYNPNYTSTSAGEGNRVDCLPSRPSCVGAAMIASRHGIGLHGTVAEKYKFVYAGRFLSYRQISLIRWPISLLRSDFSPTLADFSSSLTFLSYAGRFLSYARPFLF